MSENNLIQLFPEGLNQEVVDSYIKGSSLTLSGGGNYSSKAFVFADLFRISPIKGPVLWIVNDQTEQSLVTRSLKEWSNYEIIPFFIDETGEIDQDVEQENKIRILSLLGLLIDDKKKIIVADYPSLMYEVPKLEDVKINTYFLSKKDKKPIVEIFEDLIGHGYDVSEDKALTRGTYHRSGGILDIFPVNSSKPIKIEAEFETIGSITQDGKEIKELKILPMNTPFSGGKIFDFLSKNSILIEDELEIVDECFDEWNELCGQKLPQLQHIIFTSFNEDEPCHFHLHYTSVVKYQGPLDLVNDLRDKIDTDWKIMLFTKNKDELLGIFKDRALPYTLDHDTFIKNEKGLLLFEVEKEDVFPHAFQNPDHKIILITDKEIAYTKQKQVAASKVYLDFLTSLKPNDLVVHADYGIARFLGLDKKTVDGITREYLKLGYAENDKLFVPIDQADKVNKFIGSGELAPKLTRLGSAEWGTITRKLKDETQQIAKELLKLYAARKSAKGFKFREDIPDQRKFEETFQYEETPGQVKAIIDVKQDMEKSVPMDRLICGDVGFGKTEVAMRASFKAVQSGKQVAFISPITILADQHYRSFMKRMDDFHIRVEMMSRFKTPKQQKEILEKLEKGEVDIVIGTHRLLQADVKFKDLGLVIVDEEQRFGVKQKEKLKQMRTEVDILTLTATPIPRTLNICLNKLRDITIINTPPPGRLPVITEVRKFSDGLIKEAIEREVKRGGQVYFLHNRVQTIDGMADKLRTLVPSARFVVAHGKLSSNDLEDRIIDFKNGKYDVLVSSTIIENGIDLSNANTLIVNNAEKFGLSQLYQLRGRVGRGKVQAYAYFLYHGQRLRLDAKKRLRAIVEASELGSGFQIAMKDLEIRGAGDILGANQHGVINIVGISHFVRMLNKAVEEMEAGRVSETEEGPIEVSIELPLTAFIPDNYIVNSKDKINAYQRLSAADNFEYLEEIREDFVQEYGKMPREVANLFRVIELKILAKQANLTNVKAENIHMRRSKQLVLTMSKKVRPENIFNLLEYNPKWIISGEKLKIAIDDLGINWFEELKECVERLSGKLKTGVKRIPDTAKAEKKPGV